MSQKLYLADTSALVRYYRRHTDPAWDEAIEAGRVAICEPVRMEFLRSVCGRARLDDADQQLADTFPTYSMPDTVWSRTANLQLRLARSSQHQGASVVDLLVAVVAQHHRLVVLHVDNDFGCIARFTGQPVQRADCRPGRN